MLIANSVGGPCRSAPGKSKAVYGTHPHRIRHTAVTEAVKKAQAHGMGLEEVLSFSRHSNVTTLMVYCDRERDVQGQLAGGV